MISVLHCKFLKIYEFTKSDKTKGYRLSVLDEQETNVYCHSFFLDNEIALNSKDIPKMSNVALSFEIWFSADGTMRYKIKNITVEK